MDELKWGTPDELKDLLCEVVGWKSVYGTEGERIFPENLQRKLQEVSYFRDHPDYLQLHNVSPKGNFLTALYKHSNATQTVVFMSHFDTVNTEEYGDLEHDACNPIELTKKLHERMDELSEEASK